jgi:cytidylate kinase
MQSTPTSNRVDHRGRLNDSVFIWGLTGAGKSTIGRALAHTFGSDAISGYNVRRQLLGLPDVEVEHQRGYWLFDDTAVRADEARLKGPTDEDALDTLLLRRLKEGPPAVFDTWFLPWLAPATFAICLEVALPVRVARIAASRCESREAVERAIREKDLRSARFALERYQLDIFSDRSPFDVIVNIEHEVESEAVLNVVTEVTRLQCGDGDHAGSRLNQRSVRTELLVRCPEKIRDALVP